MSSEVLKQTFRLGAVYDLDKQVFPSSLSSFLFLKEGKYKRYQYNCRQGRGTYEKIDLM